MSIMFNFIYHLFVVVFVVVVIVSLCYFPNTLL